MSTSKYKLSDTDNSGRDYYRDETTGAVFADVVGQLNAVTEEGEPLYPIGVATPEPEAPAKHRHYELCYRAHSNTSFYPENRAVLACRGFDEVVADLKLIGAGEQVLDKIERLFVAWQSSRGNCISSMITGPANFPTRRAEKANQSEHNRYAEYWDYYQKVKTAMAKEAYYEAHPEARPISSTDSDAVTRLTTKLEGLESQRTMNNAVNKIVRQKPKGEPTDEKMGALEKLGVSHLAAQRLFVKNCFGGVGIESYVNQNLGGNIKRIKERIAELKSTAERETESKEIGDGVQFVTDTEAMRVYFEFPGKPDDETRTLLKSNGFKWTPSQGHWGRKLTTNAEYSAKRVTAALAQAKAA
jgi:hypothetical protein